MTIMTAVVALILAAAPARAASSEADLRRLGDTLLSISDQDYRAAAGPNAKLERSAAAGLTYRRLAADRRRAAEAAGLDASVKASAATDAKLAGPDAELLVNTGYWDDLVSSLNSSAVSGGSSGGYRPAAVAAVRGGRKLNTDDDKEISRLLASVDAGDKALSDGATTPAKRAQIHLDAARSYDAVAVLAAKSAPAETAAPAAPAPKALSAKELYAQDAPSVVLILAGRPDGQGELGTGSVIDAAGRVLTNAHVVIDDRTGQPYSSVRIYLKPAKVTGDTKVDLANPIPSKVARYDRALDLAVLEPSRPPRVPALTLGDDASVETGDPVVAIGHPEQGGLWTLTQGVVSTVIADLGGVKGKNAFQTDASINRGNSGGPLIDRTGAIIGVNTSMARKAADGLTITSVNFSIKSSVARAWLAGENPPAAPAAVAAADAPAAPAATQAAPAPAPVASLPPAPKTKPVVVTPAQPYRIDDVLEQEMKEMEDLESEMQGEIRKRAGAAKP